MAMGKVAPAVFTGHGSPTNAIDGRSRARVGWREAAQVLGKPRAIVAVSAHWATGGTLVSTASENKQVFDMYGFPDELYQVRYAPAGDTALAEHVLELLGPKAQANREWGIDHGVWSALMNMYPEADVPVVMVSCDVRASAAEHFETGRRLASLRDEGVMIFGSGNVVHNLSLVDWGMDTGFAWADAFDAAIKENVTTGHFDRCVAYETIEGADLAVPTTEHYLPLLDVLGAVRPGDTFAIFNDYRELGSMSMTSYAFGF